MRFTADYVPAFFPLWALLIDIGCLAALIGALLIMCDSKAAIFRRFAKTLLVLICAVAIYEPAGILAGTFLGHHLRLRFFVTGEILAGALLLGLLIRYPKRSLTALRTACLILSPFFAVLLVNGWRQYRDVRTHAIGNPKIAGMLPAHGTQNRFTWVIFDELDSRMIFDRRPPRIQLPEIDRFRSESLDATRVESPAMNTPVSIPSLLLGDKNITCVRATTDGKLLFKRGNSLKLISFDGELDIFEKVRAAGFNTGVSGWLFPYCRWIGDRVSDCGWGICGFELGYVYKALQQRPLYAQAWYLAKWQLEALPFLADPVSPKPEAARIYREVNISTMKLVLHDALRMLRNPDLNLVFIHFPIPHPPGIWDTRTNTFTARDSNYLDNLVLSDRVLGQMRHTLEQTGDWERSTILISSDHPFRPGAWTITESPFHDEETGRVSERTWFPYIPFLQKMPFQKSRVPYGKPFNSVLTERLVLKVLNGRLPSPESVVRWLDENSLLLSAHADPTNNSTGCE